MEKQPQITVTLLSSALTIIAHSSPLSGGMLYSAYMQDGTGKLTSHHFAMQQPYVKNQTLVMDSSEIYLSDGAALLVADFLKNTCAHVSRPPQNSLSFFNREKATA